MSLEGDFPLRYDYFSGPSGLRVIQTKLLSSPRRAITPQGIEALRS